jgi:hypothetical protein
MVEGIGPRPGSGKTVIGLPTLVSEPNIGHREGRIQALLPPLQTIRKFCHGRKFPGLSPLRPKICAFRNSSGGGSKGRLFAGDFLVGDDFARYFSGRRGFYLCGLFARILKYMNCPHCQGELLENYQETRCPNCGCDLAALQKSTVNPGTPDKAKWGLIFWLAFLGTPILVLLAAGARARGGALLIPVIGAIVAGFSLAKIYTKTPAAFFAVGIIFTIGVLAIYVGIIFVGCLVVMGHSGF